MFEGKDYPSVGYISPVAIRSIGINSIELSWYPNTFDRFHQLRIWLPRTEFVVCVDTPDYDTRPRLFVRGRWLTEQHMRQHSVFAIVDADGVKASLASGNITRRKLLSLRKRIDAIAKRYPEIAFVSFADSLLLKGSWRVGQYDSKVKYSYVPETFIHVLDEVRKTYAAVLGLGVYAVLAQGTNEYSSDELIHISSTQNHVSLNSLGLPFAQLQSIEIAARHAVKSGLHQKSELYMDEDFYHSLQFNFDFSKNERPSSNYCPPMRSGPASYFYMDIDLVRANLKSGTGSSAKN